MQFQTFSFANESDTVFGNVLDTKYAELQSKYIYVNTAHINYLLNDGRNEAALLMLHKYEISDKVSDKYKLECIDKYVIESELRNNVSNYYRFAVSQWFSQNNISNTLSQPITAHYFVQPKF